MVIIPITSGGGDVIGDELGFLEPTTTGSPQNQWTNPSNGIISNEAYATAATVGFRQDYADFGFSIPAGNAITGIQVKIEGSGSTAAGTIEAALSWDQGVSTTTVKTTTTLTTADAVYRLGGASDTWGRSWSVSEFSNTNFRLRLVAKPSGNTVRVDALQVKVFYQAGGGGAGGGGGIE